MDMFMYSHRRTRRTHSEAFKQSLIEACGEPGASVAGVALANGINVNRLRRWMRKRGVDPPEPSWLSLCVAASEPMSGFVPVQLPPGYINPRRGGSSSCRQGQFLVSFDTRMPGGAAGGRPFRAVPYADRSSDSAARIDRCSR